MPYGIKLFILTTLILVEMKTKSLRFLGAAAIFAAAMFVNASVGTDKSSQDVNLTDLANATEANAECVDGGFASGKCLSLSQVCVFAVGYNQCDPYSM